jgi:hypothetical protein
MKMQDSTRKITLALAVLIVMATSAGGHHIRGIPHYSYRDNYPETPVYEVIETEGRYQIVFTYYSIPGQQALDLAVYIKDTISGEPFTEPVIFRVFGRHEDPELTHPFTAYRNNTNVYKVGWVYEEEGDYFVRVTFADSTGMHNILLDLKVGESRGVWLYVGGSAGLIFVFLVITAALKRRRSGMEIEA